MWPPRLLPRSGVRDDGPSNPPLQRTRAARSPLSRQPLAHASPEFRTTPTAGVPERENFYGVVIAIN
jgi:hypothetical protein